MTGTCVLRYTWRRHKLGILGEAALGLHADFEGVQRVDCSLAGSTRYCSRQYVTRRLGVNLNINMSLLRLHTYI